MKKLFFISLIVLVFITTGCSHRGGNDIDDPIKKVQLTVNVIDALNDSPVDEATVLIENINKTAVTKGGKVTFSLSPGEYLISVSKDGYMSNGSKSIRVEKNTTTTLEMGKEIKEKISEETKHISNGLYKLDFSDLADLSVLSGVELSLKNSGLTNGELNELIKDHVSIETKGNIILLELDNFEKNTPSGDEIQDLYVNLDFKVPVGISRDNIRSYDLLAISYLGEEVYKTQTLVTTEEDGFYSTKLALRHNGENINKFHIFLYREGSKDINYNPTVDDAKYMVESIKIHGVNLTEAGTKQVEVITNNFNDDLTPYAMAIARRFEDLDLTFDIFSLLTDIGPGKYNVNLPDDLGSGYIDDYLDLERIRYDREDYYDENFYYYYEEKYEKYLENHGLKEYTFSYDEYYWQIVHGDEKYNNTVHYAYVTEDIVEILEVYKEANWEFTYDSYTVNITHSDDPLIKEDRKEEDNKIIYKYTLDYTNISYSFRQTSTEDPTMEWLFSFKWDGSGKKFNKVIKEIDEYDDYTYVDIDTYILPEKGTMHIDGRMTDSIEYEELPAIGDITLDGELDMFVAYEDIITFSGNLFTEEFAVNGDLEIIFSDKNIVEKISKDKWPFLDNFSFNGLFTTDDYKINGLCSIGFIDRDICTNDGLMEFSLPEDIELLGSYENTTEDYFYLDGKLAIELDYSNGFIPDFRDGHDFETDESYLQYTVNINGDLDIKNYASSALNLTCKRTDYSEHKVDFEYLFPVGSYITGKVNIRDKIEAEVTNQDNLLLTFEFDGDTDGKIGKIQNKLNTEVIFAEIKIDTTTGEPCVYYNDDTSESLLP